MKTKTLIWLGLAGIVLLGLLTYNPYKHSRLLKLTLEKFPDKFIYTNKARRLVHFHVDEPKYILLSQDTALIRKMTIPEMRDTQAVVLFFYDKLWRSAQDPQQIAWLKILLKDFHFYNSTEGFVVTALSSFVNPERFFVSEFLYDSLQLYRGDLPVYSNDHLFVKHFVRISQWIPDTAAPDKFKSFLRRMSRKAIMVWTDEPMLIYPDLPPKKQVLDSLKAMDVIIYKLDDGLLAISKQLKQKLAPFIFLKKLTDRQPHTVIYTNNKYAFNYAHLAWTPLKPGVKGKDQKYLEQYLDKIREQVRQGKAVVAIQPKRKSESLYAPDSLMLKLRDAGKVYKFKSFWIIARD